MNFAIASRESSVANPPRVMDSANTELIATVSRFPAARSRDLAASAIRSLAASIIVVALIGAAALAALCIDMPLARYLAIHEPHGELVKLVHLVEVFSHGMGVLLIVLAAVALDGRGWRIAPRLLLSAYSAGLAANVCKLIVARTRPYAADLAGDAWQTFQHAANASSIWSDHQFQSFPSAHTATAAGLAMGLSTLYPRASWFFALLVVLAGTQRVLSDAHFVSDVLAGAAVGVAAAQLWRSLAIERMLASLETAVSGAVKPAQPEYLS